ncbi:SPDY domain-containing protein [Streptomyces malaysiensis]
MRILFDHEAGSGDPRWTIAAYESPVSERMWHMTLTRTVPAPVVKSLLDALGAGDAWETALGSPITDKQIAEATQPLTAADWRSDVDGQSLRWNTQQGDVGVQFDTFAAHNAHSPLHTWTLWAGPDGNNPTWTIRASVYTPAGLLADLAEELAHGTGTRQTRSGQPRRVKHIAGSTPAAPPPPLSTRLRR